MNYALIFAGGTGNRMNSKTIPKQFLKLHGKEIMIYTIEHFEYHPEIDGISVVCLESWIPYFKKLVNKYQLSKVKWITPGGATGQESIFNGLDAMRGEIEDDSIVLIHDGVRPLIDMELISENIRVAKEKGCAITSVKAYETIALMGDNGTLDETLPRDKCWIARAPQSFKYKDIMAAHDKYRSEGVNNMIDSATIMKSVGMKLYPVEGKPNNIKITTPMDYYTFKGLIEAAEHSSILGV